MPAKPKRPKQKTADSRAILERIEKDQQKEKKMMTDMTKKERLMKWLLIGIVILLLLLILFAGYATDWLRGLSKDSATKAPATSLDAAAGGEQSGAGTTDTGTGGGSGTSTQGGSTGQTNTGSSQSRDTSSNNTSKESSSTSTTTNNSTTNNTTTTPSSSLLGLLDDISAGDTIDSVLNTASQLGIAAECHNEFLIQQCEFKDGDFQLSTKNLLGTGIVTSVTNNF